ncbi:ROK family transcriptional regulator [Phytoactinopolyspora mesophila]|uniref:ROK family protein n=1 Tax=Phytoactinopolyspora mesophila TaxID=2650750 RepID=A0A7K3M0I5_9ACTN|nr:ROK family transcriptional regulator [Phytoactinopolyspora mesophila]NDL56784.1 ROK family protein [Phytoactinopolyspora mesophila]
MQVGTPGRGHADESAPTAASIISLLAAEHVNSRRDIARELGLAPSTVSLRVQELIDSGLVVEDGSGTSTGGRRPRMLRINRSAGHVLVADLGGRHARLARMDLLGEPREAADITLDVAAGPEAALETLAASLAQLNDGAADLGGLRGVGLALPGPVDVWHGRVDSPSRMPGWHHFPIRDWMANRFAVPCAVENDANAMALAEHRAHHQQLPHARHSILAKAGAAIGCGLIVDGRIYRGGSGAAGDITHVRVSAADHRACSCGNVGCLETIASGSALVRALREDGLDVNSTAEVVEATRNADPIATTRVRNAGRSLGETLSPVVNFVNPDAVFLGGLLSVVEPFVAAVRSQLYEGCHPLITRDLHIGQSRTGPDAGIRGVGRAILDQIFAPA